MPSTNPNRPTITGSQLRAAASHFPTGVAIVSTLNPSAEPVGCTVSSFLSVSMEPPIVAVSLRRESNTVRHLVEYGSFAVSVLASEQRGIAQVFANPDVTNAERFAGVHWRPGRSEVPLLENGLSCVECEVRDVISAGDHYLILGAVQSIFAAGWGTPLVHHQGTMGSLHR